MSVVVPLIQSHDGRSWRMEHELHSTGLCFAWRVRNDVSNEPAILKAPRDLRPQAAAAARARWALLPTTSGGPLPAQLAHGVLPDGAPFVLLEDAGPSLHDTPGLDGLALLEASLGALAALHRLGHSHGNLKPTNIHLHSSGRAILSDPKPADEPDADVLRQSTPGPLPADLECAAFARTFASWLTPEIVLPARGWPDRRWLDAFQDAAQRWADQRAEPIPAIRFAQAARRLVARAWSEAAEPSPPYRFYDTAEMHTRFEQTAALLRPKGLSVGEPRLQHHADRLDPHHPIYVVVRAQGSELLADPELLGLGTKITRQGSGERVPNLNISCSVEMEQVDHARYIFRVPPLPPDQYRFWVVLRPQGMPAIQRTLDFQLAPDEPSFHAVPLRTAAIEADFAPVAAAQPALDGPDELPTVVAPRRPITDHHEPPAAGLMHESADDPATLVERLSARARFEDALREALVGAESTANLAPAGASAAAARRDVSLTAAIDDVPPEDEPTHVESARRSWLGSATSDVVRSVPTPGSTDDPPWEDADDLDAAPRPLSRTTVFGILAVLTALALLVHFLRS